MRDIYFPPYHLDYFMNSERKKNSEMLKYCINKKSSQIGFFSVLNCRNVSRPTRDCAVCCLTQPERRFDHNYSKTCRHTVRNVCNTCTYNSIKTTLNSTMSRQVSCPESNCSAKLNSDEIRRMLVINHDNSLLEKYDI